MKSIQQDVQPKASVINKRFWIFQQVKAEIRVECTMSRQENPQATTLKIPDNWFEQAFSIYAVVIRYFNV